MLDISKDLFEKWNEKNIRYFHWKGNEHLQCGLNGMSDQDVYVHPDDKNYAERILINIGYLKFISQKGSQFNNVFDWIGFDYSTGKLLHLHLHYVLIAGKAHVEEYILPWDEIGLATRIKDKDTNVFVSSPNFEIIVLYTRIVLKSINVGTAILTNQYVPKKYVPEIRYLKQRMNIEKTEDLCSKIYTIHGKEIFEIINKSQMSKRDFVILKKFVEAELSKYNVSNTLAILKHFYYTLLTLSKIVIGNKINTSYISKKVAYCPGFSVSFVGADGSGKSTISSDICKWLNWKIECKRIYLGSGEHYFSLFKSTTNFAFKIIKKTKGIKKDSNYGLKNAYVDNRSKSSINKKGLSKYVFNVFKAKEYVKIANNAYKQLKKSEKYQNNGGIAIYDRFPQIQFKGIYDGPKIESNYSDCLNKWPFKMLNIKETILLEKATEYKPSVVFKLIIEPELSMLRKPDHNYSKIKKKADITEKILFINSTVYEIDASQKYDDELLEIKRLIWKELKSRSTNKAESVVIS